LKYYFSTIITCIIEVIFWLLNSISLSTALYMLKYLQSLFHKLPVEITRDKLRDALRLALQSSIAAAVTFTVMRTFGFPEIFLAIMSAVLIMESSIGNTFNSAKGRVLATIVGIVIWSIFVSIIPYGYGTVVSLLVTMFIMNAIASFQPSWRYWVVAAVAISLGSENDLLEISLDRLLAIGIGIWVGLLVAGIIWPEKSSNRALKHIRYSLNRAQDIFKVTFKNIRSDENDNSSNIVNDFHLSLGKAKDAVENIHLEKVDKYNKLIDGTEKLYNSILIIHRVSNNSDTSLLNYWDNFKKNCDEFSEKTCEILTSLINKEMVDDTIMQEYKTLIKKIKKSVLQENNNEDQDVFRHAFVFGIQEIHESLRVLEDIMEAKK